MKTREINNKHYIDAKIVMLSCEDKQGPLHIKNEFNINQHLYITSNEEIKEDNWYIDMFYEKESWSVFKAEKEDFESLAKGTFVNCKKIIATTDSSLKLYESETLASASSFSSKTSDILLPQPSKEFIQSYIKSHNNGNIIVDVLVEAECSVQDCRLFGCQKYEGCFIIHQLKLKDNTIIIKKKEETMYSFKEIIDFVKWYSSMKQESVVNAWNRYQVEK